MVDVRKEVEAILFSAGRTVLLNEFLALLHIREPGIVKEAIKSLIDEYSARDSPVMIVEEGDGWKLNVKEKFLQTVQRINPHTELSKSILETLSVIAWKQPVLQSTVIKIRTNKAYDHISELERLGFIAREKHSRSFILKVTQKFLDYFDLPDMKMIKETFKDFKDIESAVQQKVDDFEKEGVGSGEASGSEGGPEKDAADEEGASVETYADTLPEKKLKRRSGVDIETYSDEISSDVQPHPHSQDHVDIEFGDPESVVEQKSKQAGAEISSEKSEETAEEKARRIARELLGESAPSKEDELIAPRLLNPKLEKMIEGMPLKERSDEKKKKSQPKPAPAVAPVSDEPVSDEHVSEEDASDDDIIKPAEEFPGQFNSSKSKKASKDVNPKK